jgi:hypothetical protein
MQQSSSVKRVKRLGGWHRIGITASILWFLVGAFWGYKLGDLEGYRTVVHWRIDCIAHDGVTKWDRDGKPINGPPQAFRDGLQIDPFTGERLTPSDWCIQESNKLWPALNRNTWTDTALYALVPIPLGWLTAYGIIALVRWIRTGFRVPTSPNQDTTADLTMEGVEMSDWIDERAANDKKKKADEFAEEETRKQKANIIKERFPPFWKELQRQVDNDCSELKKKLPDSVNDHFLLGRDQIGGFTLTCEAAPPFHRITVRPDFDRQRIDVLGSTSQVILVTVVDDGRLSFTWKEKTFAGVVDLSQALIEFCKSGQFRS